MSGSSSGIPSTGLQGSVGNGNWVYQGRKEHGHFGDGTRPDLLPDAAPPTADEALLPAGTSFAAVVQGSIAAMPPSLRARYERVLTEGATGQLEAAMKIWTRADAPNAAAFDATYFHDIASPDTATRLWAIAVTMSMTRTPAAMRGAAGDFGAVMQTIGVDALPRIATALATRAQAGLLEQNTRQLADLIYTEARGATRAGQLAVGLTVVNRMRRNQVDHVEDVWSAYSHNKSDQPGADIFTISQNLLSGKLQDMTDGATHYYYPYFMPKKGDLVTWRDVKGGLESVPEVERNKKAIENYRPSFSVDTKFQRLNIPGVPESEFKFYRAVGNGPVR